MKIIPLLLALLPLVSHASDDSKYCENGIPLDDTYEFYVFQETCDHEAGLVSVRHKQSGKEGYVDYTGKIVIPATFDDVYGFADGLSLIKQNDRYGYINTKGKLIIKPTHVDAWSFSEGLAKVSKDGKTYGFIDKTGKFAIKPTPALASSAHAFTDGLLPVKSGDKWGYWNKKGKLSIPYAYDFADYFAEGHAVVAKLENGQMHYGHINTQGEITTPLTHQYATGFFKGVAMLISDDKLYHINPKGETVPDPQLDELH